MVLLDILGGVALILFGIRFLRKGLERMFGHSLHAWLERMAQRPVSTLASGAAVGTIAPSSTAQTLLSLQLLQVPTVPPERVLIFLLGTNIGITAMVQLIALRFFDYYGAFLVAGLIGFQFCKRETIRGIGQTLLGLGFIYLAMSLMSGAAAQMTADRDFDAVFGVLLHHRLLLVSFAAIFTFVTQSSTASIGLALAVGEAGAGSLALLIPVVLGANLGIGLNSLAAGWGSAGGRKLATANLVLKGAAIAILLACFEGVLTLIGHTPGGIIRQAADFHTAFNVAVALVGMLVGGPLDRLLRPLFAAPADAAGLKPVATHLDPTALASPVFALANASRETLRLADEVKRMYEGAWRALQNQDANLAREVQRHDDRIDELNTAIKLYLSSIPNEALTPRDTQLQFGLLNFCSQLESIGDIIDKNICSAVIKHAHEKLVLAADEQAALQELYTRVLRRMEGAISVLATRERGVARQFLKDGDQLKEWCIEVQKQHYQRLVGTDVLAVASSKTFLDLVNVLRRIAGQLNTIGHTFALEKL
ncbi:MAG TPA: Na/Pi cotransporter family protein [Opitutaceae bacterium]|jgi:phosphate:Na+ symporter|nr:Na/Pi cotransporter family protein [Opitutaceae bacterium]